MTRQDEIRSWFQSGVQDGSTHMLVCLDTFDHTIFPVYVEVGESIHVVFHQKESERMSYLKVNEVYNLSLDMEAQIV